MEKVSRRGGFSDRNGIRPENAEIQLKSFDDRTRIQIQNMIDRLYFIAYGPNLYYGKDEIQAFIRFVIGQVFSETVDSRKEYHDDPIIERIRNTIFHGEYDEVLTLVEALIQYWDNNGYRYHVVGQGYYDSGISFYEIANELFEKEFIGYRFVDKIIIQISDSYEINAINEAINNRYSAVYEHISKANKLLADREKPDYENSIKESISAVEAICSLLTGSKGGEATLGNMLKQIEQSGHVIHGGLKKAFSVLYGYTSDANGIRHAGDIGGPASTFEEAKFMLVACCAFINYLSVMSSKTICNNL